MSIPQPVYDPSQGATYAAVDQSAIAYVEIFPPLGIARVGDSTTEYFYAPEVPGQTDPPTPDRKFRDGQHRVRRQAVRFRVYAYNANHEVLGELNASNGYTLTWKAHVKNMKPASTLFQGRYVEPTTNRRNPDVDPTIPLDQRTKLIVDSHEQRIPSVGGSTAPVKLVGDFFGSNSTATPIYIGELHVDNRGRLVFLGGLGHAQSVKPSLGPHPEIISGFDSIDWTDDVCDGWVNVEVKKGSWTKSAAHTAAVLSGPPKFAWGVECPTTLYDIMENLYLPPTAATTADFYEHIWPVLSGTYGLSWVNNQAFQGHGPFGRGNFLPLKDKLANPSAANKQLREDIFFRIRKPDYTDKDQATTKYMPRLSGDNGDLVDPGTVSENTDQIKNFAAFTALQYHRFELWKDGKFTATPPTTATRIEDVSKKLQPRSLTRAILEQAIGDPLYPGIETWWITKLPDTYDLTVTNLDPPFRIKPTVLPGNLTRGLGLPWHSDFDQCDHFWWPSVRPDDIVTNRELESAMSGSGTTNEKLAQALTNRRDWTRGLRNTPADTISYPGSTDMVKFWNYLGFVKKRSVTGVSYPVYVESERLQLPPPEVST